MKFFGTSRPKPDYLIVSTAALLVLFGLAMLSSASSDLGEKKFGDTYFYLKHQVIFGLSFGTIFFLTGYFIPYKFFKKIAVALLILNIIALILVFTPLGFSAKGADRWLRIGPMSVQPSEFLKFTFIAYLAAWLSSSGKKKDNLAGFLTFFAILAAVSGLVLIQPSTSTVAVIVITALVMYFFSGVKIRYVLAFFGIGLAGFLLISYFSPYRWERITGFFNAASDVQGAGFQLNQALIAMGAGGLWGTGYGQSTSKYTYLPESIGDSIFPVIAEELGFAGAAVLIAVFLVLIVRGFMTAKNVRDQFGKLLAVGISSVIFVQTFVHIAANSGLLPLTGITLPLISYGGTSLAVFMGSLGVLANVSRYA